MTILEVCFSPALGGLELYCLKTAHQLEQRGHQVYLWLAEGSRLSRHPLVERLNVRYFSPPAYFDPIFCWKAGREINAKAVDIVHLHRSRDLASFSLLKRTPKVLTLQIESTFRKRDPYHRFAYSRVDRILTITERMRNLALEALPVEPERVFSLYYGVDIDNSPKKEGDSPPVRQKWNIPEDAVVIGLVGRLEPSKGQDVLLQALAKIYAEYPQVHVLLVGDPPPEGLGYDQKLKALAQELQVSDRVHFIGFQPDLADIYAALDIGVLASRKESFGLVLLEAMARGVPMIATEAGGVPEIVQDGINGLLILPGDSQALAEALIRLIGDEDLRRELAEAGRVIVKEKFSLDQHLQSLEVHFEQVIEARRLSQ